MTSPLPTELLPGGGVGHSSVKGSVSGPAEGDSGQPTQSVTVEDELAGAEADARHLLRGSPDSERTSSTSSASSPTPLRSKRTLAFWLVGSSTTVARGALRVLRALVVEPTDPCRYRGIVGDVWAGTSRAS